MEKTYLYSVNPRRTVTGLKNVKAFRSPKSLFLTLDDVKECLKNASVHRRFANEGIFEKVTIGNCERLHNDRFMTEEEYEEFKKNQLSKNSATVKAQPKQEEVKKVEAPKVEEKVVEEKKETVVEEVVDNIDAEIYESDEDETIEKVEE